MGILFDSIDTMTDYVVAVQKDLVAIPALGPDNDGDGEREKTEFLKGHLKEIGFTEIREMNAPCEAVSCGYRPNLACVIPGRNQDRIFWVISHIDVVPPGDLSLWSSDPYELQRDGDRIVGRGVEDNHQGLVSSLCLARALFENSVTPEMNLGLIFVADEETGSTFGLEYIVNNHSDLFGKDDMFLVPDFGEPGSALVEVAEKSVLWTKFIVEGRQCHASTPDDGINSLVACSALIVKLKELCAVYNACDELFKPPYSTFEPTKKDANVENVNTLPGRDVFYLDARILPEYDLDEVLDTVKEYCVQIESEYSVKISFEVVTRDEAAPPTSMDSEIVKLVSAGIEDVYGVKACAAGVGGGTVAAHLRRKGLPAVVWSTLNHQAHQPNEWASISATLNDAKVMAHIVAAER